MSQTVDLLPDGRLRLADGALEVVVSADGGEDAVETAFRAAAGRFASLVPELAATLSAEGAREAPGLVAARLAAAVAPHPALPPLLALPAAAADEILDAMTAAAPLAQAFVDSGGAIAIHLDRRRTVRVSVPAGEGELITLSAGDGIGGVAVAGRRGRRFGLGLADAVTVVAAGAAEAAAAAHALAAAVDLPGHPGVERRAASSLDLDGALGERLVVVGCLPLTEQEKSLAVARGARAARILLAGGYLRATTISLQGHTRALGSGGILAPGRRRGGPDR